MCQKQQAGADKSWRPDSRILYFTHFSRVWGLSHHTVEMSCGFSESKKNFDKVLIFSLLKVADIVKKLTTYLDIVGSGIYSLSVIPVQMSQFESTRVCFFSISCTEILPWDMRIQLAFCLLHYHQQQRFFSLNWAVTCVNDAQSPTGVTLVILII